jgi:hypothetical protein
MGSLGEEYVELGYSVLWAMRLVVFARKSLASQISCVDSDQVPCGGPGGKYGNKGGCAISL